MDHYHQSHGALRLDPEARNKKHTHTEQQDGQQIIRQTLIDQEELNDFAAVFTISTTQKAILNLVSIEQI